VVRPVGMKPDDGIIQINDKPLYAALTQMLQGDVENAAKKKMRSEPLISGNMSYLLSDISFRRGNCRKTNKEYKTLFLCRFALFLYFPQDMFSQAALPLLQMLRHQSCCYDIYGLGHGWPPCLFRLVA
ncbi:MAG: hypothetical protein FWD39_05180, partial [Clostridiales bacterium]|nr:hypothetical protein [Clostridiales bacterium]